MTAIPEMRFGLDVSSYQDPARMPYADPRVAFVIAKATEGTSRDKRFHAHVSAAVGAGKIVGAYHFFHPEVDPLAASEAFSDAAAECGYGHEGDIVPAIDVEFFAKAHPVDRSWNAPLRQLCDLLEEGFGSKPLLYMGGNTWACLGSPAWTLPYPLWVPMYWADGLVPGQTLADKFVPHRRRDWAIWQRYVGPAFGTIQQSKAGNAIDQNWAQSLPLIQGRVA